MRPLYNLYKKLKGLNEIRLQGGAFSRRFQPEESLYNLQEEKRKIRILLQKYKETFEIDHGRGLKFNKDLAPINRDYQRYKSEEMLSHNSKR